MSHKKTQDSDIVGGVLLVLLGGAAAIYAYVHYDLGTLDAMGPGYFPLLCGLLVALVGSLLVLSGWRTGATRIEGVDWRSVIPVALGIAGFALTVRSFGLFPASMILTFVVGMAGKRLTWLQRMAYGVVLSLFTYVLFAVFMGLQLSFVRFPG